MKAILITTGDELTSGRTVDTNSAWLAEKLLAMGIPTISHHTVGDDASEISDAVKRASQQADLVLVTGGLGPTPDDLTRQAIADLLGVELCLDEPSLKRIEGFFQRLGRQMVQANRIQAMIPKGASAVDNDAGTAPGIAAGLGNAAIICMPGVPAEMKAMFESGVRKLLPIPQTSIATEVLKVYGVGESDLSERLNDILTDRDGPVVVGTTVADGLISLTITATADQQAAAKSLADQQAAEITKRLGTLVIGGGSASLASAVGELLIAAGQTVALAESCTAGLVGHAITSVGGASEYFLGGAICYANEIKHNILGVPQETLDQFGAVSPQTALAMAQGARKLFSSDWSISLTGIAGPGGGTDDKPVGLVYIGLAGPGVEQTHRRIFNYNRQQVRNRATQAALNYLRLALTENASRG
ncbi:MAG: competence/damage-inducible protein A [Phycisphaerales bacterium]|jgi:nicotinamide-nucleotide amidase|nr:competence/damage-inducible protein A [Phycisphaerales bacterium]